MVDLMTVMLALVTIIRKNDEPKFVIDYALYVTIQHLKIGQRDIVSTVATITITTFIVIIITCRLELIETYKF